MDTVWLRDSNGYLYYLDEEKNRKYKDILFDEKTIECVDEETGCQYRENTDGIRQYIETEEDGYSYFKDKTGIIFRRDIHGNHEYALSSKNIFIFIKPVDGLVFYIHNGLLGTKFTNESLRELPSACE
jgi:hypothetical protein